MSNRIHPELLAQLAEAASTPLQAVILLRGPDQTLDASPERISAMAKEVLQRVADQVGHGAMRTNILSNLSAVIVQADRAFINALVAQPEVASALPNLSSEDLSMNPVDRRPL